jgi:hypothetical protein
MAGSKNGPPHNGHASLVLTPALIYTFVGRRSQAGTTMKWIVMPAALAGLFAFGGGAQAQQISGCFHYSDGTVFSSVCLDSDDTGSFNLEYVTEDPTNGMVKGSCTGVVTVTSRDAGTVNFSVPYQEDACRQEDAVFRVAKRDYACTRQGATLTCDLTVFYDDGTIFSQATGLKYGR